MLFIGFEPNKNLKNIKKMESTQKQFDLEKGNYILDIQGPKRNPKELWSRNFEAESEPFVYDGVLYICENETFYAIDPMSGKDIWEFKIPGQATMPVFYEDLLIFGGYYIDSHVYALDKKSGKQIWKYRTGPSTAPVKKTPVINNDLLYLSAGKTIHCLAILTGKKQWTFDLKKKTGNTNIIIASDRIYVSTQEAIGKEEIQCIVCSRKELLWKIKTPNLCSNIIYVEGNLFYLNTNAELCQVNTTSGEITILKILSFELTNRLTNASLTYNNGMLVLVVSSYILALNITTNPWSWQWNFKTKAVIGRPVISKEVIYFTTMGDGIYALHINTGKELFHKGSEVRSGLSTGLYDSTIFIAGSMTEKKLTAYHDK